MPKTEDDVLNIETQQAAIVRRMLGHYETEPRFLAMMVPEFVQYQLSKAQIDYDNVDSLQDEFNKDTPLTAFFKELWVVFKKYFSKYVES